MSSLQRASHADERAVALFVALLPATDLFEPVARPKSKGFDVLRNHIQLKFASGGVTSSGSYALEHLAAYPTTALGRMEQQQSDIPDARFRIVAKDVEQTDQAAASRRPDAV